MLRTRILVELATEVKEKVKAEFSYLLISGIRTDTQSLTKIQARV